MILIGTSGFSYSDWAGVVYPSGLPARERLEFYAREFSTVELNVTYYRVPDRGTVEGWVAKTPADFVFAVKAHGSLTHERNDPDFAGFVSSLGPLMAAGKLGCVLAQFPFSFHPSSENREYLKRLRAGLGSVETVIEFRNARWVSSDTMEMLQSLGLGFCCVDEPRVRGLMPPVSVATSNLAYVRFHGRNAARWYNHDEAWQRYDYTYSLDELREWTPRLRELAGKTALTLVYFNNHFRGQAVQGARDLAQLLLDIT